MSAFSRISTCIFFGAAVLGTVVGWGFWAPKVSADAVRPTPDSSFAESFAKSLTSVTFEEDTPERVSVYRVEGDYNRSLGTGETNLAARQAVAQAFYEEHGDLYDFLVVFTTFDYDMGGARGFYVSVQNDTEGIGLDLFDYSAQFGSGDGSAPGRLQGYIDMGDVSGWELNARLPEFEEVLETLAHETLHRWCCFVDVDRPDLAADALRGLDGSHWSDLLDSGASLLYGHDWQDLGDGTFQSVAIRKFYGPLDLYLAGFLTPAQVSDRLLIENPALDPAVLPDLRQTADGTALSVSIDDVIQAEGPRVPSAADAPKSFRTAFLLLARPGDPIEPADLVGLERLRREFAVRFSILTGGQGRMEIYPEGRPDPTGAPIPGTSDGEILGQVDPTLALDWLRGRQRPDGSWLDVDGTDLRDTQVTFEVLSTLDGAFVGGPAAVAWLGDYASRGTDDLARRILALHGSGTPLQPSVDALRSRQNADGSWGADTGYGGDALDTALAVRALAAAGVEASVLGAGLDFLRAAERPGGGWSGVADGPSRSTVTTQVMRAFQAAGAAGDPAVPRAVAWLATKQNPDGGFGDSPSSVHDTAGVLDTLLAFDALGAVDRTAAEAYLAGRQQVNGSWDGSVYATALAVRALRSGGTPNFVVQAPTVEPAAPRDGEHVSFEVPVGNLGGVASSVTLALYDGDPASGGVLVEEIVVPDLAPNESRVVTLGWSSFDGAGSHVFVVLADPNDAVAEASELDNRATVTVEVEAAPAGAELEARPADLQIVPPDPDELPADLSIFLSLRNLGQAEAQGARVRLWRGELGTGTVLYDQLHDLPGRSTTPVQLVDSLAQPGTTLYTLELDADGTVAEEDETDNVASTEVVTRPNLDLEILDADLRLTSPSAVVGADLAFELDVRNRGTVDLERNVALDLDVLDAADAVVESLPSLSVFLTAGEQRTLSAGWRPSVEGDYRLRATFDLSGTPLVLDSDPDNQQAELAFQVGANTLANLRVVPDSWTLDPATVLEGAPLTVGATIENAAAPVGAFDVVLYDGHPDSGAPLGSVSVPGLGTGETTTVSFTWSSVPDAQERTLFLRVDDGAVHDEISEDDNLAFLPVRGLSLPDAALSSASLGLQPSFPRPGQGVTLSALVTNLGEQPADGLRLRLLRGSTTGETLAETVISVAGGSTATASLSFVAPVDTGEDTLYLVADPDGELVEGSTANNVASLTFAVQDGNVAADPRIFSPNGDGVLDATTLFLRLGAGASLTVEVESERGGEIVRRFENVASGDDARVDWDGRADSGALVDDGPYVFRVLDAAGNALGEARVTVDTNRSPLLDALGTSFALEKNLSCDLPPALGAQVTEDEQWVYFRVYEEEAGYPAGVYRMGLDGSSLTPLVTLPANQKLAAFTVSGDGSTLRYTVDPDSGSSYPELRTLDGHQSDLTGFEGSFLTFDASGDFAYALDVDRVVREDVYDLQAPAVEVVSLPGAQPGWTRTVAPSRAAVAFRLADRIHFADLRAGTTAQALVESTDLVWSWDGRRLLAALDEPGVDEGGVSLAGTRVALYEPDGTLLRIVELPLDPVPAGLYEGVSIWDPESAGSSARYAAARWDVDGERVAVRMDYELEFIGQRIVGSRYVVIEADSGAAETVAWSRPQYSSEGGGSEPETFSPDLVSGNRMLWVPHNEALVYWTAPGGTFATAGFFSGSRVPFLEDRSRVGSLRTSETGHWLLAEDVTASDPTNTCAGNSQLWMLRSLHNLTADLRVRRTADGTAILEGTAADAHFRSYTLEYASVDAPDAWSPIAPPSSSPVFDDVFQPWSAPAAGTYLVRLTVEDRAGNRRAAIRRVSADAPRGVTDVYLSASIFSPDGDGELDQVTLHYRTLGPWIAEVEIENASGQVVQTLSRVHGQAEVGTLDWDGRNLHGQRVADGLYRIRFGAFELDARVDTRAPDLLIRVVEPYTLYNDAPVLDPVLIAVAVKDRPLEQIDAGVETGAGQTPSSWQHLFELAEVDPSAAGNPGDYGDDLPTTNEELLAYIEANDLSADEVAELALAYAFATGLRTESAVRDLTLTEVSGLRYRLRAEDEVANDAVLAADPPSEKLMLFGLRTYDPGIAVGRLAPTLLERLILQGDGDAFVGLPVISLGGFQAHLAVGETLASPVDRLDLQYRLPGATGWSSLPVLDYLHPDGGLLAEPTDGLFETVIDLAQIPSVEAHELRLRAVDAGGEAHVSKRFRVGGPCRSAKLVGIVEDPAAPFQGSSCLDEEAVRQTLVDLLDELGLDVASQTVVWAWEAFDGEPRDVRLKIYSESDPAFYVPQTFEPLAVRDGVMLFLPELECEEYVGRLSLTGETLGSSGEPVTVTVEDAVEMTLQGGCLDAFARVEIVAAETCGTAPPGEAVVALWATGEDLEVLRLETESGQVLFSRPAPVDGLRYDHVIDFDDHPVDGVIRLAVEAQNLSGRVRRKTVAVPVDRTAPIVDVTFPDQGQQVCGYSGQSLELELSVREELAGSAVELASFVSPRRLSLHGEDDARILVQSAEYGFGADPLFWTRAPVDELPVQVEDGAIVLEGSGARLPPLDSEIGTRLELVGLGGHRVCVERSFTVDTLVEPVPAPTGRRFLSPNGDGIQDLLILPLSPVSEAVQVDLEIYGSESPGISACEQAASAPLATPRTNLPVPGATSTDWDGGGLADGEYLATLVTRDACGNRAESSVCVVLDTAPPSAIFVEPQAGASLPAVVDVQIQTPGAAGGTVYYGVGTSPTSWRPIPRVLQNRFRWNTFGLAEGPYTLRAVAVDAAGNQGEALLSVTVGPQPGLITYLEAAPALFSPQGDGRLDTTAMRFGLAQSATITAEVRTSGGTTVRALASSVSRAEGAATLGWDGNDDGGAAVADGSYLLWLRAETTVDGLPVVQVEQVPVVVDTAAPTLAFDAPVDGGFLTGAALASATVEDTHLEFWSLSRSEGAGAPVWQTLVEGIEGPVAVPLDLDEGPWRLLLEARDAAANTGELSIAFTVDSTPPVVALTAPAPGTVVGPAAGPVEIAGTVLEEHLDLADAESVRLERVRPDGTASELSVAVDGATPSHGVSATWDPAGLADGTYVLRLTVTDRAGQVAVSSVEVVVDATAPTAAITAPTDGSYVTGPTEILGTAADEHLRLYELDLAPAGSGAWSPLALGTEPVTAGVLRAWTDLPSDGAYDLRLRVEDLAGWESEARITVHVDTRPPSAPTGLGVQGIDGDAVLAWEAAPESDVVHWRIFRDGAALPTPVPVSSGPSFTDPSLGEGSYVYAVVAVDAAGWESEPSAAVELDIDFTPPTVSLITPVDGARVAGLVDVKGTAHARDLREYRLWLTAEDGSSPELLRRSPVPVQVDELAQWSTLGLADESRRRLRLEAEDLNGNEAVAEILVTVDNAPPSAPTALDAQTTAADQVTVTWTASPETDVVGYLLYRDGEPANADGPVVGDLRPYLVEGTSYVDAALPDGTFVYAAYAMDAAGNLSDPSNEGSATVETGAPHAQWVRPEDGAAFELPLDLHATVEDRDGISVRFDWRPAAGSWAELGTATERPYLVRLNPSDLGLVFGDYEVRAVAVDGSGNTDPAPETRALTYADVQPPAVVEGLAAQVDGDAVTLTWQADAQDPTVRYHVERLVIEGWQRLTPTPIDAVTFVETGVEEGLHSYAVVAVDVADNEADPSSTVEARVYTPELVAPFSPTRATLASFSGSAAVDATVEISLQRPASTEEASTEEWTVPTTSTGAFDFDLALDLLPELGTAGGEHLVTLSVVDADGNRSKPVAARVLRAVDPSVPQGLVDSGTGNQLALTWNASPEADVVGYRVFENGEPVEPDQAVTLSSVIDPDGATRTEPVDGDLATRLLLAVGESLEIPLGAERLVPRVSVSWGASSADPELFYSAARFRLEAAHGPGWVTLAEPAGGSQPASTVVLADAYRTDTLRLTALEAVAGEAGPLPISVAELEVSDRPLATSESSWSDLLANGVYRHAVSAVNGAGFESARSALTPERTVGDVVPPTPPVLSASVTTPDVQLTWTAPADAVTYELYRDGVEIAGTASTSYVDADRPNGTYEYTVVAYDAAGNGSDPSNAVSATVAVAVPGAPTLLFVRADPEIYIIYMDFDPPTSGEPVNVYAVLRSTTSGGPYTEVGRVDAQSSLRFWDEEITFDQAYYYVVVAYSATGNVGPASNELSATVEAPPGAAPSLHYPAVPGRSYTADQPAATLVGRGQPGTSVTVRRDGQDLGTATPRSTNLYQSPGTYCLEDFATPIWPSTDGRYLWVECGTQPMLVDWDAGTSVNLGLGAGTARWIEHRHEVIFTSAAGEVRRLAIVDGAVDETASTVVTTGAVQAAVPAFDGESLAVLTDREGTAGLWRLETATGQWTLLHDLGSGYFNVVLESLAWSPDDRYLAWIRGTAVEILDVAFGTVITVTSSTDADVMPDWSPDAGRLLYAEAAGGGEGSYDPVGWSYSMDDGSTQMVIDRYTQTRFGWSPDGKAVWVETAGEGLFIESIDLATGEITAFVEYSDGNPQNRVQWNESGYVFFLDKLYPARVEPIGRWQLADVPLVDGDNVLTAAVGSDGSDPVTVIYGEGGGGGGPDPEPDPSNLAIELSAAPSTALVGDTVRTTVVARNHGPADAPATDLAVVVSGPDGFFLELATDDAVPSLAVGGAATFVYEWQAPAAGDYTVAAGVDVSGLVDETDETDNAATVAVRAILVGDGPELDLATDAGVYALGQTVRMTATVLQTALEPWSGTVRVELSDAEGYPVAFVGEQPVTGLGFGESTDLEFSWPVGATFAGDYTLRAELAADGTVEAEALAGFAILPSFELAATVQTDRSHYAVGAAVRVDSTLSYVLGNTLLQGVALDVVLLDAQSQPVASFAHVLGTQAPGASGSFADSWTAAAVGTYGVELTATLDGEVVATASTTFEVTAAELELVGELSLVGLDALLGPPAAGDPLTLDWTVEQTQGDPLTVLSLRVALRSEGDVEAAEVVRTLVVDPFAGTSGGTFDLPTEGLAVGTYVLTLEAEPAEPGDWTVLDGVSVELTDQASPAVAIQAPIDGEILPATVGAQVAVSDPLSAIESVELRLDDGLWVNASQSGPGLYGVTFAGLAEGGHVLEARTTDAAGNVGTADPVSFTVDVTAPMIEIAGVEDGGVYGSAVTLTITVTDTHAVYETVLLDGAPFASGTLVDTLGVHVLQVSAVDAAGNAASSTVTFTLSDGDPLLFAELDDLLAIDVDGDGEADPGDRLGYVLVVHNLGDGAATTVDVTVEPIDGALPVVATAVTSHGSVITEMSAVDSLVVSVGTLGAGQTATVTFEVEIDPDLAPERVWIDAQGRVTSTESEDVFTDDPATEPLGDRTRTVVRSLDTVRCAVDPFDALSSDWQLAYLGDADLGGLSAVGGRLRVSGNGSSLYHGDDHGVFAFREADGDFRVEVSVADLASDVGGQYRKAGLMARSGLEADAARLMAMYVPDFPTGQPALQFDVRLSDGGTATELSSTVQNVTLPARVAFTRRGDSWTVSYTADGVEWIDPLGAAGGTVEVPMAGPVLVGTAVASYDPQQAFAVDFDDFRLCHGSDLPLAEPGLEPVCDPAEPLDLFYLLDLSQSMKADLADDSAVKLDAARDLLADLHQRLSLSRPTSRAALVTFAGSNDAAYNLAQSVAEVVPVTTDLGSVATAVAGLSTAHVPNLASTPTAIALDRLRELVTASAIAGRRPVLIWLTDGLPNIDREGFGPLAYNLNHVQDLSLLDDQGLFLSWGEVAWLGRFNGDLDTYDGEPLANAMAAFDDLAAAHWELAAHGVALLGDGVELGGYHEDVVLYGARATGGTAWSVASSTELDAVVDALEAELTCQEVP